MSRSHAILGALRARGQNDTVAPLPNCAMCGTPVDSQCFDASSVVERPTGGRTRVLARFELPARHCGVLKYFAQFTDTNARSPHVVQTPDLHWTLLVNRRPLHPYEDLAHIVNPWGFGSFEVAMRLPESAVLECVVRDTPVSSPPPLFEAAKLVGARLVGRYWYDCTHGDIDRPGR